EKPIALASATSEPKCLQANMSVSRGVMFPHVPSRCLCFEDSSIRFPKARASLVGAAHFWGLARGGSPHVPFEKLSRPKKQPPPPHLGSVARLEPTSLRRSAKILTPEKTIPGSIIGRDDPGREEPASETIGCHSVPRRHAR